MTILRRNWKLDLFNSGDSMKRAKNVYRIAHKVKAWLSEVLEIDLILTAVPQKYANKWLDDMMVLALFHLTLNILEKLDYRPIEKGPKGERFVSRKHSQKDSTGFTLGFEPATAIDEARNLALTEHIERLKRFAEPAFGLSERSMLEFLDGLPLYDPYASKMDGKNLYNKWLEEFNARRMEISKLQSSNP